MDEKDRLGAKLREKEKAEEDRYFARRDKELLEKLKQQQAEPQEAEQALMRCPKCGAKLNTVKHHDVTVEECPACQGMWLDRGELEILAQRENEGWLSRFVRRGVLRQD
ncbi:MAG: zf-TFIIB domain-containing protein [Candidatus Binatia bacterium]